MSQWGRLMKAIIFVIFVASGAATFAQTPYKCNIGGAVVYQDRPCPGFARRADSLSAAKTVAVAPIAPSEERLSSSIEQTKSKLERDKEYIDQRVKARNFERDKDLAAEQLQNCYSEVDGIQHRINHIAASAPQGAPLDRASAINLQLDQQRRQTEIVALQSQAQAKRSECDIRRDEFNRTYRK